MLDVAEYPSAYTPIGMNHLENLGPCSTVIGVLIVKMQDHGKNVYTRSDIAGTQRKTQGHSLQDVTMTG